jgi:glyoxylase-like metal-dependent hydrolase (beta-lactamase superfamily II)
MSDYPIDMSVKPEVEAFFDPATNTISYVVKDPSSNACAVIDSVMDIDYAAGRFTHDHADAIIDYIRRNDLQLTWIIETHVHADHLSAAPYIQNALGGKIGIGDKIMVVQETFGKIFNEGTEFQRDGSQFDALFKDGDTYMVGNMQAVAIYTPGHTPACMVHVMGDAAFVGDTLFMPDGGSAVPTFPAAMRRRFTTVSRKCCPCRTRRVSSCATTMAPMAAISSGRPRLPPRKSTTSTSARVPPKNSS